MDSPSAANLTRSVSRLAAHGHRTTATLTALRDAYPNAAHLLAALGSQATAISASLEQLHALLLRDGGGDVFESQQQQQQQQQLGPVVPELRTALDAGLTGCALAFACVGEDAERMGAASASGGAAGRRRLRMKTPWREDAMKEALAQLRALRKAVRLLVRALSMSEAEDVERLLREDEALLARAVQGSRTMRAAHPGVKVPESAFAEGAQTDGVAGEGQAVGAEELDFNHAVAKSSVYRAARAAASRKESAAQPAAGPPDQVAAEGAENGERPHVADQEQSHPVAGQEELKIEEGPVISTQQQEDVITGEVDGKVGDDAAPQAAGASALQQDAMDDTGVDTVEKSAEHEEEEAPPPLPTRPGQEQAHPEATEQEEEEDAPPLPPRRRAPSLTTGDGVEAARPSTNGAPTVDPNPDTTPETSNNATPATDSSEHGPEGDTITPSDVPAPPDQSPSPTASNPVPLTPLELTVRRTWQTLLVTELAHITTLTTLRTTLRADALRNAYPVLTRHLDPIVTVVDSIVEAHVRYFLEPLRLQLASVAMTDLLLPVFRVWCRKASAAYQAFCQRLPHAVAVVRATVEREKGFRKFMDGLEEGVGEGVEGLVEGLAAPMARLDHYCETLDSVAAMESEAYGGGGVRPTQVDEYKRMLMRLRESCGKLIVLADNAEELRDIQRRLESINFHHVEGLDLTNAERKIVHQGSLACKTKGKGLWNQVHCVLLDNYLFWGRIEQPRESWFGKYKYGEKLWVLEAPMPASQLQCAETGGRIKSSILDNVPRGTELYPFTAKAGEITHLFAAATQEERQEWLGFFESSPR